MLASPGARRCPSVEVMRFERTVHRDLRGVFTSVWIVLGGGSESMGWIVLGFVGGWLCRGGCRGAAGRAGTGLPLAGPVVRTVLPGPAPVRLRRPHAPHPRRMRATPGPSCREPGSRQVFPEVPGARVEAARPPRGEDPLSTPGRRPRSTSWRAGETGRRKSSGRGDPAPRPGQDGADPARAPQLLPCAGRCTRRISATGAHTAPP